VNVSLKLAIEEERERCALIAETEPLPDGPMPAVLHNLPVEDVIVAAIKATILNIARRIREQ